MGNIIYVTISLSLKTELQNVAELQYARNYIMSFKKYTFIPIIVAIVH